MEIIQSLTKYFLDCYRSDNRELQLFDMLDRTIENKIFISGKEEILNLEYPKISIDQKKGDELFKKLELFQKEKELIYAAFHIIGTYKDNRGEEKRLCAPFVYYPAQFEENDGFYYVSIDVADCRINYPLLSLLNTKDDNSYVNDAFLEEFSHNGIHFEEMRALSNFLSKYFPQINCSELMLYPKLVSSTSLKARLKSLKKGSFEILPSSIIGLVSKSNSTRGVLNELEGLTESINYSTPLINLFTPNTESSHRKYNRGTQVIVPSEAQQRLIESSFTNTSTLIYGPPGTGKTYTISAIAIEHMSKGESVLIVSRTDEAVDVVAEKIEKQTNIEGLALRVGRKWTYKSFVTRYLKALLTRVNTLKFLLNQYRVNTKLDFDQLLTQIEQLEKSIARNSYERNKTQVRFNDEVNRELEWGEHLSKQNPSLWDNLKSKFIELKNKLQTPVWELSAQSYQLDQDLQKENLELLRFKFIHQIYTALKEDWASFKTFHEALKLSSDTEKFKKFEQLNFQTILKAFPIWLCNLSELKDSIPFTKELFDVVIIDEATQCDIASCLPAIQRAKRVVFTGDPNQLRHVSFLSKSIQKSYARKHNLLDYDSTSLNYRDTSILDLAIESLQSKKQVAMLDEHFRSHPSIISFSNEQFYDSELKIMTARPLENEPRIVIQQSNGTRSKQGINEKEASDIIDRIHQIIKKEDTISADYATSIGILSPFRAQSDFISKALLDQLSAEQIRKHHMKIGTAYSFQGEEKDIMLLSFAVDKETHPSAFIHLNKADVFNVAVTRARNHQEVYLSVDQKSLKKESLLYQYLNHSSQIKTCSNDYKDDFLDEVESEIQKIATTKIWTNFAIAGVTVDLLVSVKNQYFAIDLIGYPGEQVDQFGMVEYQSLHRAGIKVFPLPYSNWLFDRDKLISDLKVFLGE